MPRRPQIVEESEKVIETFIHEWQMSPYLWMTEADVQAEIATRIRSILQLRGIDKVLGNYPDAISGFEGRQLWSIVTCEPTITYKYKDQEESDCRPDIVIWDKNIDNDNPPGILLSFLSDIKTFEISSIPLPRLFLSIGNRSIKVFRSRNFYLRMHSRQLWSCCCLLPTCRQ
jgi:hypothetical protein